MRSWVAEQRRTIGSTGIKVAIASSIAMFAGFAAFHFGTLGMTGSDIVFYYAMLSALLYCSLAYQLNRFGASRRREELAGLLDVDVPWREPANAPSVSILIPTYREERRVLIGTIVSAALAEYANRRIVVLVDDSPADQKALKATLSTIEETAGWLKDQADRLRAANAAWQTRKSTQPFDPAAESRHLVEAYRDLVNWLNSLAARLDAESSEEFSHVDGFVIEKIVRDAAARYRSRGDRLASADLTWAEADTEHARLAVLLCDDIGHFQRKTFDNLSHAPNKAMNLNAYIGLMGGRYVRVHRNGVTGLEPANGSNVDMDIPRPDYVLTLDADSVILNRYVATLVEVLESDPTAGVAQTPYLTFPNGDSPVERIAGATTDIQYLVHQGSSWFDAAYWVGANALIRFSALEAIAKTQVEAGKPVKVFIQDKTVIEDTGSTIDLLQRGWRVQNHFVPLAYSATPADFGALAIQRKRWANGGLIILPELLREYMRSPERMNRFPELVLRTHYLLSPVIGNVAVFMLMIWAGAEASGILWTPVIMLPYFALYMLDLRRLGYRARDLFGVCALNLMLLPVNFAGILASIVQMVTGRKGSFNRTPKVSSRTYVPPYALLFNLGVLMLMLAYATRAVMYGEYSGAVIPIVNILLYSYGLIRFVGILDSIGDMFPALRRMALACTDALTRLSRLSVPFLPPMGNRYVTVPGLAAALILLTPAPSGSRIPAAPESPAPAASTSAAPVHRLPMTMTPPAHPVVDGVAFNGSRLGDPAPQEGTTVDAPSVDPEAPRP
ncbi:glycosyltransferase family 2 protein [Aquibium carbonis]|uniref:glycosyltransferase family 2 protein n=1 Tax=Aquibium carbonis TaxID=2495581 RepID=UPI001478FF53|nr:glycosyltransferase family 2 protein [Aquibium carbonis]